MDPSRPKSGVLMGSPVQISSLLVSDGSSCLNYISFTKKNWPNASTLPPNLPGPFAGLLFCTSVGVLNYGSSTVEMSMRIGERLLDLSLRDAQATTEKEALVPKRG